MKDNMDILLEKALKPNMEPDEALNVAILENGRNEKKKRMWHGVPKVAVAVLVFALVCPAGVYAANFIIKQVSVTEHAISVGNTEYVDDKALEEAATSTEEVKTENISHEEGNANVKWLTKDVQKLNGDVTNTYYAYDDYKAAIADSKLDNLLSKDYTLSGTATYVHTKTDTFEEDELGAYFEYGEGQFYLNISKMTGNVAEDVSSSLYLSNTGNQRKYTSKAGAEFTLVDEVVKSDDTEITTTYVVVSYGEYYGFLSFNNLSDDEIHQILDTVQVAK